MQVGSTLNKFLIQVKILPITVVGPTTGTITLTNADFNNCIVVAGNVISAIGATDSISSYFIDTGNVAAGCSIETYLGLAGSIKGGAITSVIGGQGILPWAVINTDILLSFKLNGTFVPNRIALFYVQYLPKTV